MTRTWKSHLRTRKAAGGSHRSSPSRPGEAVAGRAGSGSLEGWGFGLNPVDYVTAAPCLPPVGSSMFPLRPGGHTEHQPLSARGLCHPGSGHTVRVNAGGDPESFTFLRFARIIKDLVPHLDSVCYYRSVTSLRKRVLPSPRLLPNSKENNSSL